MERYLTAQLASDNRATRACRRAQPCFRLRRTRHAAPAIPRHLADALSPQGPVVSALRAAFPQALAVYAFGSQLAGTAHAGSDLDLAVLVACATAEYALNPETFAQTSPARTRRF